MHFNPHSLIAARRLDANPTATIDARWVGRRLDAATRLRERLFAAPFHRLVHAEADGLPGLVIDRFDDAFAVQANTAGMDALLPEIAAALTARFAPRLIVARNDSAVRALEGLGEDVRALAGTPGPIRVEEGGLRFAADLLAGQKTGWFFDQRENRDRVAALAPGATVLDAFCHRGGFGLRAALAGATRVLLLDSSAAALGLAATTARDNGLAARVETRRADALEELTRLGAAGTVFDIVVTDPPAFAKSRKDQATALRGYAKLARLAAAVVAPGGFLFAASCSHHVGAGDFAEAVAWGVARGGRTGRILGQSGAAPDHPVHPMLPESAYLKAMLWALD